MSDAPLPDWLPARLKLAPVLRTPHAVCSVDQATRSGWCIHTGGTYRHSGALLVHDWAARAEVLTRAYALSAGRGMLFAFEDHASTPLKSYKATAQVLALGAALGLWLDTVDRLGHLDIMILGVSSRAWRKRVLGADERVGREELKAQAVRWAQAYTGKPQLSDDESEAVAIGAFASREPLVQIKPASKRRGRRCALR